MSEDYESLPESYLKKLGQLKAAEKAVTISGLAEIQRMDNERLRLGDSMLMDQEISKPEDEMFIVTDGDVRVNSNDSPQSSPPPASRSKLWPIILAASLAGPTGAIGTALLMNRDQPPPQPTPAVDTDTDTQYRLELVTE